MHPVKKQLIKFSLFNSSPIQAHFVFCGFFNPQFLIYRLGNRLSHNLSDDEDVLIKCPANGFFATFDPPILTFLFESYCLSLYSSCLWKLSCKALHSMEVAFNKNLEVTF